MAALGFTPASDHDVFSIETGPSSSKTSSVLSGKEIRHFYENLIKGDRDQDESRDQHHSREHPGRHSSGGARARRKRRRGNGAGEGQQGQTSSVVQRVGVSEEDQRRETRQSERSMELLGLRLLRCAHEGDIPVLKELLSKGVDINFQDAFFWTAVMCASWSGQRAAVRLLLQHGAAWVGVVDTQGRDAKDLALEAGHSDVVEELMSYGRSSQGETQCDRSSRSLQSQWCDVCGSEYSSSLSSHLSSTLHQFSLRRPPPTPYYCLPPSSNSYKMMVRCGWKPGTGLGPEGEGPQQPVPTVLKRDQEGLGFGHQKRAKVTHFQAGDKDAVKPRSREERGKRGQRKEECKRKEEKDKNWERDFRASFYS
ncbi:G patch domain and ankyrin repeat-containing protein 1 [Mugil cephalus]|uniref:G patch domain and ankyrin repeat-containing protein 1 n=1 Tax=Mugil cephalus TaxID=48193 RepID=UPI001FB5EFB3|nr:G patch domain and ankyrin repeat-containing protein 1 [Mugil cephalus]XP_047434747.1 G patch domain and ankyrin repeat-containing protein 1 [Mugil cephalus]